MQIGRGLQVLSAGVVLSLMVATGVQSVGEGGRVRLGDPIRVLDTRLAAPVTFQGIGSGVLMVWVVQPASTEFGTATIHPCNQAPLSNEYTFYLDPANKVQYARFATGDDVCLTSTIPVDVVVDRLGDVSETPSADRDQFVALANRVELFEGSTTEPSQVVEIAHPADLSVDATAAVIALEVIGSDSPGYLSTYDCDGSPSQVADVSYSGRRAANVAYVPLGAAAKMCIFAFSAVTFRVTLLGELAPQGPNPALLPPSWRYVPGEVPAPSLHPIVATRVLDTRKAIGRSGTTKASVGEVVEIDFGDLVGPTTSAVVLNVAVAQPDEAGHIRVWPCGGQPPLVASLNYVEAQTVANLVVSKLSPSGTLCLQAFGSAAHLIADLNGTYETDGGLQAQPVEPTRIFDSRKAIGTPTTTRVPAGTVVEIDVVGSGVVPAEAGAVTANFAIAQAQERGHLTVFPCDEPQPTAANLNYAPGEAVANLVTAKLSATGTVCAYTFAETHLIVDVAAWYGLDSPAGLVGVDPSRYLDTRKALGIPTTTKIDGGRVVELQVGGVGSVPGGISAVVMNITAVQTEDRGFVTAWACGTTMPTVSNLNYEAEVTRPNLATVPVSASGKVCLYTLATTHLVADVTGYLTADPVEGIALILQ